MPISKGCAKWRSNLRVFVQMMLKSMREAIPQESMFNSESTKMYTSLYDQQIAQDLSKKGLGFADMIEKQLSAKVTMEPSELAGKTPMPLDSSDIFQSMPTQALGQLYRAMQPLQNAVESTVGKLKDCLKVALLLPLNC